MAANINGLIYYKLDSDVHGYPGDITKNCGLRGEEIDGNFNFLRGHDIKSFSFDENGTLCLTRYNGDIISAKQSDKPDYDFSYSPETGELTIVTPDGKEMVISGFKVETHVFHDCTLEGIGTQEIPLEVSNITKTGRYKPAIRLIDTTVKNEDGVTINYLPEKNNTKHDRYVTKEKISKFGRLYPLHGVEAITNRLNEISSEWHVPTKEEWDEILNEIDCAVPNHTNKESNVELGEFAGATLKSTGFWNSVVRNDKEVLLSEDVYGFTAYPVGYCGNRGKEYYGSFGQSTAFWTSSVEDNHKDMYVKKFEYNKETVGQHTWGENYYISLRLVKKFTGDNFNESEFIDGFTVNCIHIPGTSTIWTKENIAFSQAQYDGFYPEIWEKYENLSEIENSYDIRYYVNDWNGNGWDKHEIKEGEGIVLYEGDNGRMHEWLLVDGELIDSAVLLKSEFEKEIEFIHDRIDKERLERISATDQLWDALSHSIEERKEYDKQLTEALKDESKIREEGDKRLLEALNNEAKIREEIDNQQWAHIEKEASLREDVDKQLWDALNKESKFREEVDNQIWANLEKETSLRQDADKEIWDALNNESKIRESIDNQQWDALKEEGYNREHNDNLLWDALNKESKFREEVDNQIWANLEKEASLREDGDKLLWESLNKETENREEVEKQLWGAINDEIKLREEKDGELWTALNNEAKTREEVDNQQWDAIANESQIREEIDNQQWVVINNEIAERKEADADLQRQIDENKVTPENNSVIIVPGKTENEATTPTTIKVNLDDECEHLKLGDNGIYFDGYFGQF